MKALLLTINLLYGADASTTHFALTHGAREVVMPTQKPWVVDSVIAVEASATTIGLNTLYDRHPKLAKGLAWSLIAARGAVVVSNLRQIHELR